MSIKSSITQEEIDQTNAAMERANGVVGDAAIILKVTPRFLHDRLRLMVFARWGHGKAKVRPPGENVDLVREAPKGPIIPMPQITPEQRIAEMVAKEDAAISKGIASMGFSGKTLESAMALQSFHRGHFKTVVDLLGGGLTQQFINLMADLEDCRSLINSQDPEPEELEMYLKHRIALLEQMNKMYDRAVNASLVSAKIQALRNNGKGGGPGGPRKPGFGALKSAGAIEETDAPPED